MHSDNITILLTDGEFTGMIRSLRECGDVKIVGFCFSDDAAHRAMLDKYYIAPPWDDDSYIPFLCDVIEKEHVDYVFPVVTKSLSLMASAAEEIHCRTNAVVVTSPYGVIEKANNKAELFRTLSADESTAEYITEFDTCSTIGELKDKMHIPCAIKPVIGENKEGFVKAVSDSEWNDAFLSGNADRLICPSLLDLCDDDSVFAEQRIIMPYLPGQEWDADILVIDGRIISATVRKNLGMLDGLSACTETSDDPRILEACTKIVKVLGLEYLSCISFKEDEDGRLKLLEINPRAMGSIYVSSIGGNNLVKRLISILQGEDSGRDLRLTRPGIKASLFFDMAEVPGKGDVR